MLCFQSDCVHFMFSVFSVLCAFLGYYVLRLTARHTVRRILQILWWSVFSQFPYLFICLWKGCKINLIISSSERIVNFINVSTAYAQAAIQGKGQSCEATRVVFKLCVNSRKSPEGAVHTNIIMLILQIVETSWHFSKKIFCLIVHNTHSLQLTLICFPRYFWV